MLLARHFYLKSARVLLGLSSDDSRWLRLIFFAAAVDTYHFIVTAALSVNRHDLIRGCGDLVGVGGARRGHCQKLVIGFGCVVLLLYQRIAVFGNVR